MNGKLIDDFWWTNFCVLFLIPLNMITYLYHANIILFASKMLYQTSGG